MSGRTSPVQIEDFWLAPAAGAVVALLCLGLVGAVLRVRRTPMVFQAPLAVALFLVLYGSLRLWGLGIHPWAAVILSLGVSVRLSGTLTGAQGPMERWSLRFAPWLAGLTVLFAVAVPLQEGLSERLQRGRLPEAPPGAANVLLLVLDTSRASSFGVYGNRRPTSPNVDRLAEDGVVFRYAYGTAPWTLPSHASLFSGRWPWEHRATWDQRFQHEVGPTLASELAGSGYATAGFVANMVFAARGSGLDHGFHRYTDRPIHWTRLLTVLPPVAAPFTWIRARFGRHHLVDHKSAADVNREFLDWVDGVDEGRPFFAFLNYFDTHLPYHADTPFDTLLSGPGERYWVDGPSRWSRAYSTEDLDQLLRSYEEAVAYVDAQVGALMVALEERGLAENTVVLVTSDHGEQFGEHELIGHSNSLYEPVLRVPLLLVGSREAVPSGTVVDTPVSLRDVPATLLDVLGLPQSLPGRSLRTLWTQDDVGAPILFQNDAGFERREAVGVAVGPWRYLRTAGNEATEELYDVVADPGQLVNLAGDSAPSEALARLEHMRALADSLRTTASVAAVLPASETTAPRFVARIRR